MLRRARNWNDPRLLREQPGKGDLSGRGFLLVPERGNHIDQCLICLAILWTEARHCIAEVGTIELGLGVNLSSQETLPKRTEWHKADSELLTSRHHCIFWLSKKERILALQRSYRLNHMGAADSLCARFRQSEMLNLTLPDQVLHCACNILNRHVQVDAMLIVKIDDLNLQPLQRALQRLPNMLRPAVQRVPLAAVLPV